jgi:hypothetical protein
MRKWRLAYAGALFFFVQFTAPPLSLSAARRDRTVYRHSELTSHPYPWRIAMIAVASSGYAGMSAQVPGAELAKLWSAKCH